MQAAAQDSTHSTSHGQSGAFVGPVSLPLCLQLGLDVRVSMELPQQPGGALDWRGEEQVDASLTVVHWGGQHAGTGTGEERCSNIFRKHIIYYMCLKEEYSLRVMSELHKVCICFV